MKSIYLTALIIASAGLASAQTGVNPDKEDMPEAEKIYSPYVERTASDRVVLMNTPGIAQESQSADGSSEDAQAALNKALDSTATQWSFSSLGR